MNLQYPDTLHLVISVSTTSFHSLLPFSSPILSFRFLSFILLSPIPLFRLPSHLSFCLPFCLPSSLFPINPTNTLKTRIIQQCACYRLRGIPAYFPPPPLCLFAALLQNILKARAIPGTLSYRLQEASICL